MSKIEKGDKVGNDEQDAQQEYKHLRPGEHVETEKTSEQQTNEGLMEHMRPGEGTDRQQWREGEPLPNADKAEIGTKFEKYSMNPNNENNGGKWKAFEQVGYDVHSEAGRQAAARDATAQLRRELPTAPAAEGKESAYGTRYEVRSNFQGPNGKEGTLATVWQIDKGSDKPRMITNWLEVHK